MSKEEKLRLLLIEDQDYEQGHANGISRGAAAVFAKWPSYVASAIWFTLFIVSLVTLLTLLIFMALVQEGKIVEQNVFFPPEEARYIASQEIQSEFCSQMLDKRHAKRQEIPEHDLKVFDSGRNVFYMLLKPLDKFAACSVESVVRLCPDKNIFLIFLKTVKKTSFEDKLKKEYMNVNLIFLNGNKILRGSPFEGKWKGDERSLFEAALLTVWQFGGTVLSENLLMVDRKLFDSNNVQCKVDPELIYCSVQCASYVYDLIGETLKSNRNASMDYILDNSIKVFCGSEHFVKTGCTGVSRIDDMEMCIEPDPRCMFVRSHQWQKTLAVDNNTFWNEIVDYCPITQKYDISLARSIVKDSLKTTRVKSEETTKMMEGVEKNSSKIILEANTLNKTRSEEECKETSVVDTNFITPKLTVNKP